IHESLDYLEGRATVFHSHYLTAWASADATTKTLVVLGHFVLPPACLQEGWGRKKTTQNITSGLDSTLCWYSQPNENPTDEPEVARKIQEEETEDAPNLSQSSEEETPTQGECPHRILREYPMNNMVTGYTSARDMKKYEGELHDFLPGTSGYTVYWVQNEINISSDTKAKMKRKL
ncbi:TERB2 protein, partial [Atlantisia rogersi]|nr:TERB2 protein [Atlantisia rogersi]